MEKITRNCDKRRDDCDPGEPLPSYYQCNGGVARICDQKRCDVVRMASNYNHSLRPIEEFRSDKMYLLVVVEQLFYENPERFSGRRERQASLQNLLWEFRLLKDFYT